jgi:ankyrin repeat protein
MAAQLDDNGETIEYLVEHGADLECRWEGGLTPLRFAGDVGKVKNVQTLLRLGADVGTRSDVR